MIDSMSRPDRTQQTDFGKRLRALREAAGFTQVYMADKLGISQPSYLAWESFAVALRPEQIEQLAAVLGVEVVELFGKPAKLKKPAKRGPAGKTDEVFQTVAKLPRHKQARIIDVVKAMVAQHAA